MNTHSIRYVKNVMRKQFQKTLQGFHLRIAMGGIGGS